MLLRSLGKWLLRVGVGIVCFAVLVKAIDTLALHAMGAERWGRLRHTSAVWWLFSYSPKLPERYFQLLVRKNELNQADFTGPELFVQHDLVLHHIWTNKNSELTIIVIPDGDTYCLKRRRETLNCLDPDDLRRVGL